MAIRLPSKTDADDGSSKEWRELGPKMPDDEFIPRGAITFREFRDWLGKTMFPDDWTGEECAGWFSGSFGAVHRSEAERDADLERRHAESAKQHELAGQPYRSEAERARHAEGAKQHELAGRPVPATSQIETAPKKRISRVPWKDAKLDGGIDDTKVWAPLTPEQRAEIDRKLEPLYGKALAVKHRREMVEPELQQIFWNGTLGAFYISQDDGRKMDIAPNDWGVKRRRGKFYSDKIFLHQAGFFHVDVSGERREFTILIDAEEAKMALSTYRDCKTTSISLVSAERKCERWLKSLHPVDDQPANRTELEKTACDMFSGLSKKAFLRAWGSCAPDQWKRAGRKAAGL